MSAALPKSVVEPAYLDRLNIEQRATNLHGDGRVAAALLVIASDGSRKTSTLPHEVAYLLVEGADLRGTLLMARSTI